MKDEDERMMPTNASRSGFTNHDSLLLLRSRHPDDHLPQLRVALDISLRGGELVKREHFVHDSLDPAIRKTGKQVANEAAHRLRPVRNGHVRIRYTKDVQSLAVNRF